MFPKLLYAYFIKHSAIHQYSTRKSNLYLLPANKKDIVKRGISFPCVKFGKQLSLIDLDASQPVFKWNLSRCFHKRFSTHFLTNLQTWFYQCQWLWWGYAIVLVMSLSLCSKLCLWLSVSRFHICTICISLIYGQYRVKQILGRITPKTVASQQATAPGKPFFYRFLKVELFVNINILVQMKGI